MQYSFTWPRDTFRILFPLVAGPREEDIWICKTAAKCSIHLHEFRIDFIPPHPLPRPHYLTPDLLGHPSPPQTTDALPSLLTSPSLCAEGGQPGYCLPDDITKVIGTDGFAFFIGCPCFPWLIHRFLGTLRWECVSEAATFVLYFIFYCFVF